ncbi:MAG TPA: hypothetical protein VEB40_03570 [Flavipsychrobacter sp.]|nr:hypothetical protein [Flavipsychrobacter sp.]
MEQMLLLTFTEKSGKTQLMKGVNDLETLMQQMRVYLDTAANDLMQPRAEAVQHLLKMARQ